MTVRAEGVGGVQRGHEEAFSVVSRKRFGTSGGGNGGPFKLCTARMGHC